MHVLQKLEDIGLPAKLRETPDFPFLCWLLELVVHKAPSKSACEPEHGLKTAALMCTTKRVYQHVLRICYGLHI